MKSYRNQLLSGSVVPLAVLAGMDLGVAIVEPAAQAATVAPLAKAKPLPGGVRRVACNPCAAKNPGAAKNPCAVKKAACNPCAAKNPCAGANPCNPCNPCAGAKSASTGCVVPRLARANPCAARSPCAAKNPCNPCAAKNPCGAKANPCAANPRGPCGAAKPVELSRAEAATAYDCVRGHLQQAYTNSGLSVARDYTSWKRYSSVAYVSATHGSRFVQNYANDKAKAYGKFENAGKMPVGSVLAKDSFTVSPAGYVGMGPLFLMEKMPAGFNKDSGNWKYTMVMPNGSIFGVTNGKNSSGMAFCTQCHAAVGETQDHMFFLPTEFRAR